MDVNNESGRLFETVFCVKVIFNQTFIGGNEANHGEKIRIAEIQTRQLPTTDNDG
jgi:hypothetical protein